MQLTSDSIKSDSPLWCPVCSSVINVTALRQKTTTLCPFLSHPPTLMDEGFSSFDFLQLFFCCCFFQPEQGQPDASCGIFFLFFSWEGTTQRLGKNRLSDSIAVPLVASRAGWNRLCLFVRPTIVKTGEKKGVGKVVGSRVLLLMLLLLCIPLPSSSSSSMCVSISPCVYFFSRIARLGEGGRKLHTVAPLFRSDSRFSFFFLPDGVSFCHREKKNKK